MIQPQPISSRNEGCHVASEIRDESNFLLMDASIDPWSPLPSPLSSPVSRHFLKRTVLRTLQQDSEPPTTQKTPPLSCGFSEDSPSLNTDPDSKHFCRTCVHSVSLMTTLVARQRLMGVK